MRSVMDWAVEFALMEAQRFEGRRVPSAAISKYLGGCVRDDRSIGGWLVEQHERTGAVAWCAAFVGWAINEASEVVGVERSQCDVPVWRAGALEYMRDAQGKNAWVPVVDGLAPSSPPEPGSLAIYRRGSANSGKGHVELVLCADKDGFLSVGGNERGGRIWVDQAPVLYSHKRLLGFVVACPCSEDLDDARPQHLVDVKVDWIAVRVRWLAARKERDAVVKEVKE